MKMKEEQVVLVDNKGRRKGSAGKMEAHEKGLLHRAFSIMLYNNNGDILMQKRAATKYHFGGLWSNACCSHPRPNEKILSAARRRLMEELGIAVSLKIVDHVTYCFSDKKNNLTEHEFDYILTGNFNGEIVFNRKEADAIRWVTPPELLLEIQNHPDRFTPWFKLIVERLDFIKASG